MSRWGWAWYSKFLYQQFTNLIDEHLLLCWAGWLLFILAEHFKLAHRRMGTFIVIPFFFFFFFFFLEGGGGGGGGHKTFAHSPPRLQKKNRQPYRPGGRRYKILRFTLDKYFDQRKKDKTTFIQYFPNFRKTLLELSPNYEFRRTGLERGISTWIISTHHFHTLFILKTKLWFQM